MVFGDALLFCLLIEVMDVQGSSKYAKIFLCFFCLVKESMEKFNCIFLQLNRTFISVVFKITFKHGDAQILYLCVSHKTTKIMSSVF